MPIKDVFTASKGYQPGDVNRAHADSIKAWNNTTIGFDTHNKCWRPCNSDGTFIGNETIVKTGPKMSLSEIAGNYVQLRDKQEDSNVGIETLLLETGGHIKSLKSLRVKISAANKVLDERVKNHNPELYNEWKNKDEKPPWKLVGLKAIYPLKRQSTSEEKAWTPSWEDTLKKMLK